MSKQFKIAALLGLIPLSVAFLLRADPEKNGPTNTAIGAALRVAARTGACSASLKDGSVLISGGQGNTGPLGSAETFSAKSGAADVASLKEPRGQHACATLSDGRVLVAGGTISGGGATNSAELFNPSTGQWSLTGAMSTPRSGAAAVALSGGRILIAGGESNGNATATLEVYDPGSGKFSAVTGLLSSPRMQHATVVLPDGRVLIAGGSNGKADLDTIDVYNPATGTVAPLSVKLSSPRSGLSAVALLDGRIWFAGGANGGQELATTEIYDPKTGTLAAAAPMSVRRKGQLAIRVPNNNSILVAGGDFRGAMVSSAEVYVPWTNTYRSYTGGNGNGNGNKPKATFRTLSATSSSNSDAPADATTLLPTLYTDQPDYSPGQTATISGAGWPANTEVSFFLTRDPKTHDDLTWTATTDANGDLATTYLVQDYDANVTFTLTATATTGDTAQIQRTITFTDTVVDAQITSVSPASVNSLPAALTVNFQYTATAGTNNTTVQVDVTTGNGSNATTYTNSKTVSATGQSSSDTIQITLPASPAAPNGSYDVKLTVRNTVGTGANSKVSTSTGAVTVNVQTKVTTDLSVTAASGTYGGTTSLNATLTSGVSKSPVSGKSISFSLNGATSLTATTDANGIATLNSVSLSGINAGTYASGVSASFAGDNSYVSSANSASLTVNKANQTITFAALSNKTYGDPTFTVSATASSGLAVSFAAGAADNCTIAGSTITITGAGSCTITASQAGDTNYNAATAVPQSFTVAKATATLALSNLSQTYDGSAKSATATVTPSGLSGVSVTYNGNATAPTNAGSYPVVASLSNANYTAANATGTLTIAKAAATVTLGGLSHTYDGTAKGATATTIPANLAVTFTYDGNATAPTNAGSYAVTATVNDTNYQGSATGTLAIAKATPTITWSDPAGIVYGTALGATQLNATASAPGTISYTPSAGTVLNAGAGQSLSASFTPTDSANYTSANKTVSISVAKADQTITWSNPADITYGTALGATQLNAAVSGTGPAPTGALSYTPVAGTVLNAGASQTLSVTAASTSNYNSAAKTVSINVLKANSSTTISAPSIAYVGDQITLTASVPAAATGTVTFFVGSTAVGTASAANGSASIQVTASPAGSLTYSAVYAGDSNFNGSTSNFASVIVSKRASSVVVSSNAAIAIKGDTITLTATVTPATATGSVQFADGGNALGSPVSLVNGKATYDASGLSLGTHSITAVYSGDLFFEGSVTGTAFNQEVDNTRAVDNSLVSLTGDGPVSGQPVTVSTTFASVSQAGITSLVVNPGAPSGALQLASNFESTFYFDLTTTAKYTAPITVCVSYANLGVSNTGNLQLLHYNGTQWDSAGATINAANQTLCGTVTSLSSFVVVQDKGTTTTVASSANPSVYTSAVSFTATVTPTAPNGVQVGGSVKFYDGPVASNVVLGTASLTNGAAQLNLNAKSLSAGSHTINAVYQPAAYYLTSTGSIVQTVNKADQAITFANPGTHTYGDAPFALTATADSGLTVSFSATGTCSVNGSTLTITGAGSCSVTASQSGDTNYKPATDVLRTFSIDKATPTVNVTGGTYSYDAKAHPATGTITGVNSTDLANAALTFSYTPANSNVSTANAPIVAGTYSATASFAGDNNYKAASSAIAATITISKVTPLFNALASPTITYGAAGNNAVILSGKLALNTLYPTGSVSISVNNIVKTAPVSAVDGTFSTTLDASAFNANPTPGYSITYSYAGDANFNSSNDGNATLTIEKALATVTVSDPQPVYDGSPKTASVSTNPASLALTITYNNNATAPTNAGTYSVNATVNETNYKGSGTGTLTIKKAEQTISWSNPADITYGTPLGATQLNATVSVVVPPAGGLTYTPAAGSVLNAGPNQVLSVMAAETQNYNAATKTVSINVQKATPVLTWAAPSAIVYGTPLSGTQLNATANVAGTFVYTPLAGTILNAGAGQSLKVDFAPTDAANYNSTNKTVVITVDKAPQTITFNSLPSKVYGDAPFNLTATSNSGLTVAYSASNQCSVSGSTVTITGAGSCTITASQAGNDNYLAATSVPQSFTIEKALATVTLGNLSQVYDGSPKAASATTNPTGLTVSFTYAGSLTAPTNAGTYAVVGTINDNNYKGSANGQLVIEKAQATLTISPASLAQTYDGNTKSVIVTTTPANLTGVSIVYTSNTTPVTPINAGSYDVKASLTNDNYKAMDALGALVIAKASQTITFGALGDKTYGDAAFGIAATATSSLGVTFSASGGFCSVTNSTVSIIGAGTCTITASQAGNSNYEAAAPVQRAFTINRAIPALSALASPAITYGDPGNNTITFSGTLSYKTLYPTGSVAIKVNGVTKQAPVNAATGAFSTTFDVSSLLPAVYPITYSYGGDSNFSSASDSTNSLTVNKRQLSLVLTPLPASPQLAYGNCSTTNFTAVLTDAVTKIPVSGQNITFTISGNSQTQTATALTDGAGTASGIVNLTLPPGAYKAIASYVGNAIYSPMVSSSIDVPIAQGSVGAATAGAPIYTGQLFAWTTSSTTNTANVTLSATIKDSQGCSGDIRTAKVTFAFRTANGWTPISSTTQNLPVGLVSPTDPTTGTASVVTQFNLNNQTFQTYQIAVIISGNYAKNDPSTDAVLAVALPGQANSMVGRAQVDLGSAPASSGYLGTSLVQGASGYLGVAANVTYNKSLTNPQGSVTATFNSYNKPDGTSDYPNVHTYQIKSTAVSSLASPAAGILTFAAKGVVQEVTAGVVTSLDGGATFQVTTINSGGKGVTYLGSGLSPAPSPGINYPNGAVSLSVQSSKTGKMWITSGWANNTATQVKAVVPPPPGQVTGIFGQ